MQQAFNASTASTQAVIWEELEQDLFLLVMHTCAPGNHQQNSTNSTLQWCQPVDQDQAKLLFPVSTIHDKIWDHSFVICCSRRVQKCVASFVLNSLQRRHWTARWSTPTVNVGHVGQQEIWQRKCPTSLAYIIRPGHWSIPLPIPFCIHFTFLSAMLHSAAYGFQECLLCFA